MVKNGAFKWSDKVDELTLQEINLSVKKGELVALLGRVGDGKVSRVLRSGRRLSSLPLLKLTLLVLQTSLLAALLGEMTRITGEVVIRGKVAYFSQQSWVLSATVKENIVFGHAYDHEFYHRVLDACVSTEFDASGELKEVELTLLRFSSNRLSVPISPSSRRGI